MSDVAPLLMEIGCEEIPARMIPAATRDLAALLTRILDEAKLGRADATAWGGTRRLAVRVDRVEARQADRHETVLGPPANVGLDGAGRPTPAAKGFARKQGVDADELKTIETERGPYLGFERQVEGRGVGGDLQEVGGRPDSFCRGCGRSSGRRAVLRCA